MAKAEPKVAQPKVDVKTFVANKIAVLNLKNPSKYQTTMAKLHSHIIKK